MNHAVTVVKAGDIKTSGGQTEGMIRQNAIVDVCDNICSSVMIAKPHTASDVHHHGEESMCLSPFSPDTIPPSFPVAIDTIIYAVRGHGSVISDGGRTRQDLAPGDFALIPAFAEHQEVNEGDEEVYWVIVRSGRVPIVKNLSGWGQDGAKHD